jgi:DHA2 family multidrug resistance protein-like MFS transporter
VALMLARFGMDGTRIALLVGAGFAIVGGALSMLRLSPAGARGAQTLEVREGQRMTGE